MIHDLPLEFMFEIIDHQWGNFIVSFIEYDGEAIPLGYK